MLYLLNKTAEAASIYFDLTVREPAKTIIKMGEQTQRKYPAEAGVKSNTLYLIDVLRKQNQQVSRDLGNTYSYSERGMPTIGQYITGQY